MDFNVGIILWPNNYSYLINMTEVEDYVQFKAALNHWIWDEKIKGRKLNMIELPMVPCSADKFYEPYGPMREPILAATPFAYCI